MYKNNRVPPPPPPPPWDASLKPQRQKHQFMQKNKGFDTKNFVEIHQSKYSKSYTVE